MANPKKDFAELLQKTGNVHPLPSLDTEKENSGGTSRVGKKVIQGHFDKDVHLKMKILAAKQDTTIQHLLEEAFELLFEKHDV